jgi:hypothetical protein
MHECNAHICCLSICDLNPGILQASPHIPVSGVNKLGGGRWYTGNREGGCMETLDFLRKEAADIFYLSVVCKESVLPYINPTPSKP